MTDERYEFRIAVVRAGDGYQAYIANDEAAPSPLSGWGQTPLEALRQLNEALVEWGRGGAERWLSTSEGTVFARLFCPMFAPNISNPES